MVPRMGGVWLGAGLAVLLTGCQTYRPEPLAAPAIVTKMAVAVGTEAGASAEPVSLPQAAAWMSDGNEELLALRQEYERLVGQAALPEPLPNPSLEAGLARAFRMSMADAGRTQPFVGLGFSLPLGDRRAAANDLRGAESAAAWTAVVARHRELYLELRAATWQVVQARQSATAHEQLLASAREMRAVQARLVQAGQAGALDLRLADLAIGNRQMTQLEQADAAAEALAAAARLIAVPSTQLAGLAVPLPSLSALPQRDALAAMLAENQPELARIRGEHAVAEATLRLEIARQYPDLHIGAGGEQEPGEKTRLLSLGATIDLPVFDRNQHAIASAAAVREAARLRYERSVARILRELDHLLARLERHNQRASALQQHLLPQAEAALADGRRLLDAGVLDAPRWLDLQRGLLELKTQELTVQHDQLQVAIELEQLIGAPFLTAGDQTLEKLEKELSR